MQTLLAATSAPDVNISCQISIMILSARTLMRPSLYFSLTHVDPRLPKYEFFRWTCVFILILHIFAQCNVQKASTPASYYHLSCSILSNLHAGKSAVSLVSPAYSSNCSFKTTQMRHLSCDNDQQAYDNTKFRSSTNTAMVSKIYYYLKISYYLR